MSAEAQRTAGVGTHTKLLTRILLSPCALEAGPVGMFALAAALGALVFFLTPPTGAVAAAAPFPLAARRAAGRPRETRLLALRISSRDWLSLSDMLAGGLVVLRAEEVT